MVPETCVNCGAILPGAYCTACGERRASDRDNSLPGFARDAAETFTNADRSFFGAIKELITRPGELTAEYMRGRRIGRPRPLQLFLLVNVAYFLFASVTGNQMFMTSLYNHRNSTWHAAMARSMVNERLGAGKVSTPVLEDRYETYRRKFDATTSVQAKTLIITMVPAFALLVGLLHLRRRRYVVEHLVFSLHIYAAFLILTVVTMFLLALPMALVDWVMHTSASTSPFADPLVGIGLSVVLIWYLRRALSRVYGDGPMFSTLAALLLTVGLVLVLFSYRTLLFVTTFWAT